MIECSYQGAEIVCQLQQRLRTKLLDKYFLVWSFFAEEGYFYTFLKSWVRAFPGFAQYIVHLSFQGNDFKVCTRWQVLLPGRAECDFSHSGNLAKEQVTKCAVECDCKPSSLKLRPLSGGILPAVAAVTFLVWWLPFCTTHDLCGLLGPSLGKPPEGCVSPATAQECESRGLGAT